MEFESQSLSKRASNEVFNPFPPARKLFEFAEKHLSQASYSIYTDPGSRIEDQKALELPTDCVALVADYPRKYFVVAYEDRLGKTYALGTRMRRVQLSTSQYRYQSDDILHEIDIAEPDVSEGKGNVIFLTVSDLVNEKSRLDLNTAKGSEVDRPSGSAKVMYEVDSSGNKKLKESHFRRLDEALFSWKDKQRPVRWVRNLDTENLPEEVSKVTYKDLYLIGRDEKGFTEEQAEVRTHVEGKATSLKSILIEIGLGSLDTAKILFESEDGVIKIVEHSPEGMRAYQNQMEIIKQDPNYAFLFDRPVDQKKY